MLCRVKVCLASVKLWLIVRARCGKLSQQFFLPEPALFALRTVFNFSRALNKLIYADLYCPKVYWRLISRINNCSYNEYTKQTLNQEWYHNCDEALYKLYALINNLWRSPTNSCENPHIVEAYWKIIRSFNFANIPIYGCRVILKETVPSHLCVYLFSQNQISYPESFFLIVNLKLLIKYRTKCCIFFFVLFCRRLCLNWVSYYYYTIS